MSTTQGHEATDPHGHRLTKDLRNALAVATARLQRMRNRHDRSEVDGVKTADDFVAIDAALRRMTVLIGQVEQRFDGHP